MATIPYVMLLQLLCSCIIFWNYVLATELPIHARDGRLWSIIQAENEALFVTPTNELWFAQLLDHFPASDFEGTKKKKFQQRFYEVNDFWDNPDGPIILYIGGEGALNCPSSSSFTGVLAKQFGAKILALEHRFYGKSVPGNDLSTQNLKYLTVEQALADLKYFKEQYSKTLATPHKNKWIAIGGSYPGALAAWFRVVYPDTTTASLSSSGVVLPIYHFDEFDQQVAESAGSKCANALRATTLAFEEQIQNGNSTAVKGLLGAEHLIDPDFFYMIADAAAMAVQYGHKDIVCSHMIYAVENKLSLTDEFAAFTIDMYGAAFGKGCFYDTNCFGNEASSSRWGDGRSWRWQKCSQLAYFQVAPVNESLRSHMVDIQYHEQQCVTAFGEVVNPKEGVRKAIERYGGLHPKSHRIYFSNGGDDPWQRAAVRESLADDEPANLAKCDLCGHCGDLGANQNVPEPLKEQRQEIIKYMTKWLASTDLEDVATQEDLYKWNDTVDTPTAIYQSSPFMLLPVAMALVMLLVVIRLDLFRDTPMRRRRVGYAPLSTV